MADFAFIPTIWAAEYMLRLKQESVYAQICDLRYTGVINRKGDSVKIWTPGSVTVGDYVKNTDITSPKEEIPQPIEDTLNITLQKYFSIFVDDVDIAEGGLNPQGPYSDEAIWALRDTADQLVFAQYANALTANKIYPTVAVTASTILDLIDEAYERLAVQKMPLTGLWLTVPPWINHMIHTALAARNTAWGDQVSLNGRVGAYGGFEIYMTNNVVLTTGAGTSESVGSNVVSKCMYGGQSSIFLAENIPVQSLETYRPHAKFGNAVKGLHVYGMKVPQSGKRLGYINAWHV